MRAFTIRFFLFSFLFVIVFWFEVILLLVAFWIFCFSLFLLHFIHADNYSNFFLTLLPHFYNRTMLGSNYQFNLVDTWGNNGGKKEEAVDTDEDFNKVM